MNLHPPPLDSTKSLNFSYPINYEYPNCVSFSGVHAGFLMAYGSSNLIIVLIEGKYISAVLKGHESTVCTVSFEIRGPHILSCDISGECFFWHYQDSIWQNSRIVKLANPIVSASWYTSRREICYICNDGLYRCSITDFGAKAEKLCNKSSFCTFNFDGTLLASHNNRYTVTIFMFSSNTYLTQVLKHPSPIETFDFHPSLPSFLTITKDHILRIWRQSILSGFACTAAIKVPFSGFFVRNPFFYSDPSTFGPQKPTTILFLDPQCKFYKLKVEENGLIKSSEEGNPFKNVPISDDFGYRAVYKTNLGTESIIVSKTKISIVSRHQIRELLFHTNNVKNAEFAPDNFWLYTLDNDKRLLVWPIFNPYHLSRQVSSQAHLAVWKDSTKLVFQEETEKEYLKIYDTFNDEVRDFDFPYINNLKELYSNNGEIFAISNNSIISKSIDEYKINEFSHIAISKSFNNHFMIVFSDPKNQQLSSLLCPDMKTIPCSNRSGHIKDLGFISLILLSVLTENGIELWRFKDEATGYEHINKIYLPGMNQLYSDTSSIGGRLLSHDDRHLFSISNGVTPLLLSTGITKVTVSSVGHIAVFYGKHFQVYPSWCITKHDKMPLVSNYIGLSQSDELLNIGNLTQDAKFIQKVTIPPTINYMVSPSTYIHPLESNISTIQSTLFHLLECRIISNLDNCSPEQIPPIPNQYAIPSALEFPTDFHHPEYENLIQQIKNVHEDIDMFGLRYLLAIKENAWPPSYFALWLSYSQSQSQICEHIISFIDANMLSKFYIAAAIHNHSTLVKIVQHSLINMWAAFQKVDNVALLYAALGQLSAISKLYSVIGDDLRADFFKRDFKVERWRKFAIKNAYSSLSHHNLEMSATLFLIAGDINLCINIIVMKLEDPMLAFLVLRLLTNSNYKSKEMQQFFKSVNWNDDVIPILISNLFKDNQAGNLLEKLILEKEKSKNITAFGDRRITLFELYFNITKKRDILPPLVLNMNQDGLAPLSNYVYGIVNCPYETFRSIEISSNEFLDDSKETEIESNLVQSNIIGEEISIEKVKDFDFGGGIIDDFDDDEWSDDDDSDGENENKNENEKKNLDDSSKNENSLSLIPKKKENKEQTIFEIFLSSLTQSLCRFYGKSKNDISDENAGSFAMRTSSIKASSRLLPQHKRNNLFKQISLFIDDCCSLFYQSAEIPLTPKILLNLILKFFRNIVYFEMAKSNNTDDTTKKMEKPPHPSKLLPPQQQNKEKEVKNISPNELIVEKSNNENDNVLIKQKNSSIDEGKSMKDPDFSSLDINKIMQYRNYKFIHSVFNGAVVVATWTYFPQFLAQLLDESIETVYINKDMIPDPQSFFDVDVSSPRFPDSIPLLLSRYTNGADQVASFERSRFLIMLLLFQRILSTNRKLLGKSEKITRNSIVAQQKSKSKGRIRLGNLGNNTLSSSTNNINFNSLKNANSNLNSSSTNRLNRLNSSKRAGDLNSILHSSGIPAATTSSALNAAAANRRNISNNRSGLGNRKNSNNSSSNLINNKTNIGGRSTNSSASNNDNSNVSNNDNSNSSTSNDNTNSNVSNNGNSNSSTSNGINNGAARSESATSNDGESKSSEAGIPILDDEDDSNDSFISKMEERHASMLKTFQFYEVALGSPLLEQPPPDTANQCGPISKIIDQVFSDNLGSLQEVHTQSLQHQSFPPIFRKGNLSVGNCTEVSHPFNGIRCLSSMSINKEKFIAVSDGGQLVKIDLNDLASPVFSRYEPQSDQRGSNGMNGDVIGVISHPTYDLFVALLSDSAFLFNYDSNPMTIESKIILTKSQAKASCAAFSPNSSKFAICSNTLDIFSFDLSKSEMVPIFTRRMKGQITAVAWVNSETSIAVAYTVSNTSSIIVVNTLVKYDQPIEVKKEWGVVTSIVASIRRGKLVFGTKNGCAIISDIARNFETTYIIRFNNPILSMSCMQELIAVGTENGNMFVFSTSKPAKSSQFETSYKINSLVLSDKMIVAAGDSQKLSVWNAL